MYISRNNNSCCDIDINVVMDCKTMKSKCIVCGDTLSGEISYYMNEKEFNEFQKQRLLNIVAILENIDFPADKVFKVSSIH